MADINNVTQLRNFAANGGGSEGSPVTIAPGTYSIKTDGDADLAFQKSGYLKHAGGDAPAIIDGENFREAVFDAPSTTVSLTIDGKDDSNRIKFTRGALAGAAGGSAVVQSTLQPITVTFKYSDFTYGTSRGLGLDGSGSVANKIILTCYNCNVNNNVHDGFSIVGTGTTKIVVLNIYNSKSFSNGSAASDQGVTAHGPLQFINIYNSEIYDNYCEGIAIVGGGMVALVNSNLHDNGTGVAGKADLELENDSYGVVLNCDFHGYIARPACYNNGTGGLEVYNSRFYGYTSGFCRAIWGLYGSTVVRGCTFKDFASGYCFAMGANSIIGDFSYNTIYNCNKGISLEAKSSVIGNVFHTLSSYAVTTTKEEYLRRVTNGYNYFYNCNQNFYDPVLIFTSQLQSTDVSGVDPQLMDPANGDFRLKSTSPCLNAGPRNPGLAVEDGYSSLGAWQRISRLMSR